MRSILTFLLFGLSTTVGAVITDNDTSRRINRHGFKTGYDFMMYNSIDLGGYYLIKPETTGFFNQKYYEYGANLVFIHGDIFISPKLSYRASFPFYLLPVNSIGIDLNCLTDYSTDLNFILRPQIGLDLDRVIRINYGYCLHSSDYLLNSRKHSLQVIFHINAWGDVDWKATFGR